jgi:hypothetical protein
MNVKVPELQDYDDLDQFKKPVSCTRIDAIVASARTLSLKEMEVPFDSNPWLPLARANKNALKPIRTNPNEDIWNNAPSSLSASVNQFSKYTSRGNLTPRITTPIVHELPRLGTPLMGVRQLIPSRNASRHGQRIKSQSMNSLTSAQAFFGGIKNNDDDKHANTHNHSQNDIESYTMTNSRSSSSTLNSSYALSSSSINPAQSSLQKYLLSKSLKSTFNECGENVHNEGNRRKALKIGKIVGGFGILPVTTDYYNGSRRTWGE